MESIPHPAHIAHRRAPEEIARHAAAVACDADKRARNGLLRRTLADIRVEQLTAAAIAAGGEQ